MNARYRSKRSFYTLSSEKNSYKPFISVSFIIITLFSLVFLKMEERRLSYDILKLSREYKKVVEVKKKKEIELAKLSRPQFVEAVAKSKLTLKKAEERQIIHLGKKIQVSLNN